MVFYPSTLERSWIGSDDLPLPTILHSTQASRSHIGASLLPGNRSILADNGCGAATIPHHILDLSIQVWRSQLRLVNLLQSNRIWVRPEMSVWSLLHVNIYRLEPADVARKAAIMDFLRSDLPVNLLMITPAQDSKALDRYSFRRITLARATGQLNWIIRTLNHPTPLIVVSPRHR